MLVNFINMYNRRFSGQPLTVSCTLFTYLVIHTCLFALSLAFPLCIGDVATSREDRGVVCNSSLCTTGCKSAVWMCGLCVVWSGNGYALKDVTFSYAAACSQRSL